MAKKPFSFGLMAMGAPSAKEWTELVRKVESLGYSSLLMPDHFAGQLAPLSALGAAAAVTDTLRIGSLVFANDFRHPAVLAKEAATLDVLSDGRVEIGLGAGWMNEDYTWTGIPHERAGIRIERMVESAAILRGLWGEGPFSHAGKHYTITEMDLDPKPVQAGGPPLIIGGGSPKVLGHAGALADIVGVNANVGAGAMGPEAMASLSAEKTDEKIGWVRAGAGERFDDLQFSILKFATMVTDDVDTMAEMIGQGFGLTAAQILESPHVMIGSTDALIEEIQGQRERWGANHLTIQADAIDSFAPVVAALAGT